MKGIKSILLVVFSFFAISFSFAQESALVASCTGSAEGKCVGSSYCTACTNCSRCGHCNSGGSCGVCSTRSQTTAKKRSSNTYDRSDSRKPSNSYTSKSYDLPNDTSSKYYLKTLIVNTDVLNLRNGPGISYAIIERLKRGQELTFFAMNNNWVKVKVNRTKTKGYVYYKHVLVSTE